MAFLLRDLLEQDLDQCLALTTDRFLYDAAALGGLRRMWQHIIDSKSGSTSAIIDTAAASHVVFFATVVFVTDQRADAYHSRARPGVALQMVHEFNVGQLPFLSREEIANANGGAGLNLVVTHHGYEEHYDESDEKLRAATYEGTVRNLSSWNVRSYTNEVFARDRGRRAWPTPRRSRCPRRRCAG